MIHTFKQHTGIVVDYKQGKGDYTLFRADMDALPIQEKTGVDYSSEHEGFMHACGHDIHMAVLLGLIEKVVTNKIQRNILFVFQPAEEGLGGGKTILDTKQIANKNISACYALHVNGNLPTGSVSTMSGVFFGIPQEFDVHFKGKAGHIAFPHEGKNSLIAANHFQQIMTSLITLEFLPTEPVIFGVGEMHSGTIRNITPQETIIQGSSRVLTIENRDKLNNLITATSQKVAEIFGMESSAHFASTYDPVVNDANLYNRFKKLLPTSITFTEAETVMTGEDFGFYTSKYPGLLFWLGADSIGESLHSSKFLPDEKAISVGIETFYSLLQ
jgi:N-acetyldiaminopimelate deacetylase